MPRTVKNKTVDIQVRERANIPCAKTKEGKAIPNQHGRYVEKLTASLSLEDKNIMILEPCEYFDGYIKGSKMLRMLSTSSSIVDRYGERPYGAVKYGKKDLKENKLWYDSIGLALTKM